LDDLISFIIKIYLNILNKFLKNIDYILKSLILFHKDNNKNINNPNKN